MKKKYIIKDEVGLHARPVSILVGQASKFENEMSIQYKEKKVTLKSIIAVMSLAVPFNETVEIEVLGDSPEVVFQSLETVMNEHNVI